MEVRESTSSCANSTATPVALNPGPQFLDFAYPAEFYPTAAPKRVGSSPLGLGALTNFNTTVTLGSLGPVGFGGRIVLSPLLLLAGWADARP